MLTLHPISGPPQPPITIRADKPARIGRLIDCEICLPHEQVSRLHATLLKRDAGWFIIHSSPRSPTWLNGVRLGENRPTPLEPGDLLRIGPWTFRVTLGRAGGSVAATIDDTASRTDFVERVDTQPTTLQATRLRLLIDCLGRLAGASDDATLARIALDSAVAGSGFPRAAVLRARGSFDDVEIVAATGDSPGADRSPLSKSLLQRAAAGQTVALSQRSTADHGQSIADLGIHSALCAPILLGDAVVGFLYLDARGSEGRVQPDVTGAAAFCEAIARAYGLALAESHRAQLSRRQAELTAEFAIAREIQERLSPPAAAQFGPFAYAGVCLPGLFVAGDLLMVTPLAEGRLAVCMGDAAGHGVAAALLMTSTHACLHAELLRTGDPGASATAANAYLSHHAAAGRFVSLWIGVISPSGEIEFVDAGHGYAAIGGEGGKWTPLSGPSGPPMGVLAEVSYEIGRSRLHSGERLILYTDGMLEQRGLSGEQFGAERLAGVVTGAAEPTATVNGVVQAVRTFAGRDQLDDDASIACIRFGGV